MPYDADVRNIADVDSRADKHSPDLVGEELGDGARIWRVYDRVARHEDRERIGNWNLGLDNLALFAGLFSAVTTAFIIELKQDTETDYSRLTFLVLNASIAGVPFKEEPFNVDPSVRLTNCLWIASLMLSLSAALIAIMGKDWIGMYASRPVCNPRQWAEIRTYRLACVERWYMSGVIASAPVLLHLSLVLFAIGLVRFVASDPLSQTVAFGLAIATGGLYLITALSAVVYPTSPFKSPATQAVRASILGTFLSVRDRLAYPAKRQPVAVLQRASLLIAAVLSHPLPDSLLPSHRKRSRRVWARQEGIVSDPVSPDPSSYRIRSCGAVARRFATESLAAMTALGRSVPARLRSAVKEYRYRSQRPHRRSWYASLRLYLRDIQVSDRWADVRTEPSPELLARSLSQLNGMTQSTDVFRAILVALGDIAIGRTVAPLVSFELKSRLSAEIRHNWPTTDLVTLSRYILAGRHITNMRDLLPSSVADRFDGMERYHGVKSESIVFALAELSSGIFVSISTIVKHCPDITIQPRALQHLLPLLRQQKDIDVVIVLAHRYWDHWVEDPGFNLEAELRRRLAPRRKESQNLNLARDFRDRSGPIELLVSRLQGRVRDSAVLQAIGRLIHNLLELEAGKRQHPCLVYALGNVDPWIATNIWAALPLYHTFLELALPLDRFWSYEPDERASSPTFTDSTFEISLARTIVRLLSPSRDFNNALRRTGGGDDTDPRSYISTFELCIWRLHTQLCDSRSGLGSFHKLEIIDRLLENSVFVRGCQDAQFRTYPSPTTERRIVNILTVIARQLRNLLEGSYSSDTGAQLFRLFAFSQAQTPVGVAVVWDIGSYIREVSDRTFDQGKSVEVSLQRLIRAIHTLRPLCVVREDLRETWNRIELPAEDTYSDDLWDSDDFELGDFPAAEDLMGTMEETPARIERMAQAVAEEPSALQWLDATMR